MAFAIADIFEKIPSGSNFPASSLPGRKC